MSQRYRWHSPGEWLGTKLSEWTPEEVKKAAEAMAGKLDSDAIQDLYESEMAADGYFQPLKRPGSPDPMPRDTCGRCGLPTDGMTVMSFFNTDQICLVCSHKERAHPKFDEARQADEAAMRQSNFNFKGIGLPSGLIGEQAEKEE